MGRMKIRSILFAVFVCALARPSWSQDRLDHVTASAGAGFTFPLGDLRDHTHTGFNFIASGGPRFNSHFRLTLDFALHYLELKDSIKNAQGVSLSFGSTMRMWSLTVNPGYDFIKKERFSAYVTGGYGLYNRKLLLAAPGLIPTIACDPFWNICIDNNPSAMSVDGDVNAYKGGYNAGGGVNFGSRTKFFIETRYHRMFTTNAPTQVIPLSFGIRW